MIIHYLKILATTNPANAVAPTATAAAPPTTAKPIALSKQGNLIKQLQLHQ